MSSGHLTKRLLAMLMCIMRSNNFQELCRPQHQYFPHMPILLNCGYSPLTGMLGGFGLAPGSGTAMSARHCAQAEKTGGVRVKFTWKWDRG